MLFWRPLGSPPEIGVGWNTWLESLVLQFTVYTLQSGSEVLQSGCTDFSLVLQFTVKWIIVSFCFLPYIFSYLKFCQFISCKGLDEDELTVLCSTNPTLSPELHDTVEVKRNFNKGIYVLLGQYKTKDVSSSTKNLVMEILGMFWSLSAILDIGPSLL